jgi:hypothetical protein
MPIESDDTAKKSLTQMGCNQFFNRPSEDAF